MTALLERIESNRAFIMMNVAIRIFNQQRVVGLAQQIAYNILFSIAPLLIFLTAFGGWVIQTFNEEMENPIQPVIDWLNEKLPAEAAAVLNEPIEAALSTDPSFILSVGGIAALWTAKNAIASIMISLNIIYGVRKQRSFIPNYLVSIGLTIALAVAIVVAGALQFLTTSLGEDLVETFSLGTGLPDLIKALQFPVTVAMVLLGVIILHRFGPTFSAPLLWYLPGAVVTVIGFAAATWGLQIYFTVADDFGSAYGVFGAMLIFIFWMFVVAMVLLIGGVVNATLFEAFPPATRALADFRVVEEGRADRASTLVNRARDSLPFRDDQGDEPPTGTS